jgi:S1-C subfamily serine protease
MLAVAVVAGLTGAAVAVTALALTGSLSPRVIERQSPVASAQFSPATTVPSPKTVRAVVTGAAAAVAQVQVVAGTTKRVGSAVVMRSDGALLTSEALVRGAKTAKVVLADGRPVTGTVAGTDPATGLAVLTVTAPELTALSRSTSPPKPGDLAVTLSGRSRPDAEPSVVSGVVSSLDQSARDGTTALWGLIETDKPVPAEADGGALVGPDGRLSGISLHLPNEGDMGYAVPIGTAWLIGIDLLEHGRVRPAWLGIKGTEIDEEQADDLNIDGGVRVDAVTPGSPGAAAGLHDGDVIIGLGTNAVRTMPELAGTMKSHRPGEQVAVVVMRAGDRTTLTATLGEKQGS